MSYIGFISRALAISPNVFLRYIPIAFIFGLVVFGLFQMTDNIYVIVMMGFILSTVGQTFLYITGVRGALQTIKATDAPTIDALMKVTFKLMFTLMLVMLLMVISFSAVFFFISSQFFLDPTSAQAADALRTLISAASSFDGEELVQAAFVLNEMSDSPGALRSALLTMTLSYQLATGITISLFGIPLAAMSANAVHKSPGNDLIYGIGRYFPHQLTLYVLATMVPTYLMLSIIPPQAFLPSVGAEAAPVASGLVVLSLWYLFAPCVSFAGMAIGYELIRKKVWNLLQQERVPIIDYEAERENVRALRSLRKEKSSESTFYDPNKKPDPVADMMDIGDDDGMDPDEFEDEARNSLRAMRQSRRGEGGGNVYDPRNPGNDD